jgi:hypothetical protein
MLTINLAYLYLLGRLMLWLQQVMTAGAANAAPEASLLPAGLITRF